MEWYEDQVETIWETGSSKPSRGEAREPFIRSLKEWLDSEGIALYSHQTEAIELIRAGEDVALTTPTASGKTLAFNLPVLEGIEKTGASALYLYPLKALANDQLGKLKETISGAGLSVEANIYDGDTPRHRRPDIRRESDIILTNPYGLHHYLPWHDKWAQFFSRLNYVLLDEAHRYRGVFGSNVALLIRRLKRILRYYDADPQFILSSATMANPKEFTHKLTGENFRVIDRDGSGGGNKHFVFWNPVHQPDRSVHGQATELFRIAVDAGMQTLAFTRSRRMAELIARWANEETARSVTSYRAGYLPEERREIERRLREGTLDGVASTNALELGVDIGGLDAVIIVGYPGSIISTWQQAGRAGRGEDDSLVIFVAFEDPLDQYLMDHPAELLGAAHENLIVDTENPHIVGGHLLCAATEMPLREEEEFMKDRTDIAEGMEEQGLLAKTGMGWIYQGEARPAKVVSLEGISGDTIEVLEGEELLETMGERRALGEAHQGAILLHRGETYLIEQLDLEEKKARARRADVDYYTQSLKEKETSVSEVFEKRSLGELELFFGSLHVEEQVTGYQLKERDRTLSKRSLDLPKVEFDTEGVWFTLPPKLERQVGKKSWRGGLHGTEHALIAMAPLFALCDRWDLGGFSTPLHPSTGKPSVLIYDGFEGGIGISEKLFSLFEELADTTSELVKNCDCEEGCPSCIFSPKCGAGNEPLDKGGTIEILQFLAESFRT